jgi:plasmid stabilization system protein ParE
MKPKRSSTSEYPIFWTREAVNGLEEILAYLNFHWSQTEVANYKRSMVRFIETIGKLPFLFPASRLNPNLRKAVLNKRTVIIYEVKNREIFLITIFDARQKIDV